METLNTKTITVETTVNAPVQKAWSFFTEPSHVTKWNSASEDWHTPSGENDLRVGGKFVYRMEAKDGSFGFDFGGIYDAVKENELIEYTMSDGRKVQVKFIEQDQATRVVETFDAEEVHSIELQRGGWQAIMDNFKKYVESN